ncbi:Zinc finger protein 382, partial [Camelus dromedarius]
PGGKVREEAESPSGPGLFPCPKGELKREGKFLKHASGISVIQGCDCGLHPGGVPASNGLCSEGPLQGCLLENYCHFVSVGFHMTKPDMIHKLEQGKELWTTGRIFPSRSYLGESV